MRRTDQNKRVRQRTLVFGAVFAIAILMHLVQILPGVGSNDAATSLGFPFVFASWGGYAPPRCCAYSLDLMALAADGLAWFGVAVVATFFVAVRAKVFSR